MLLLTKIASVLVTPLAACVALLFAGLIASAIGRRKTGIGLICTATALLWTLSTPFVARAALGSLERIHHPTPLEDMSSADVAIVLGGALGGTIPPRTGPDLGDASDRLLYAFNLYRAGKVRAILVSGGNLPWTAQPIPEAEAMRDVLTSWGVAADAILLEGRSRTTAENAREVAAIWPSLGTSSALLVTSAFHMPRALASFRKAGIPIEPAVTDIRVVDTPLTALDLMPDAEALADTSIAMKEAAGYLVYRLRCDI